jgi:hypothetical protein
MKKQHPNKWPKIKIVYKDFYIKLNLIIDSGIKSLKIYITIFYIDAHLYFISTRIYILYRPAFIFYIDPHLYIIVIPIRF